MGRSFVLSVWSFCTIRPLGVGRSHQNNYRGDHTSFVRLLFKFWNLLQDWVSKQTPQLLWKQFLEYYLHRSYSNRSGQSEDLTGSNNTVEDRRDCLMAWSRVTTNTRLRRESNSIFFLRLEPIQSEPAAGGFDCKKSAGSCFTQSWCKNVRPEVRHESHHHYSCCHYLTI